MSESGIRGRWTGLRHEAQEINPGERSSPLFWRAEKNYHASDRDRNVFYPTHTAVRIYSALTLQPGQGVTMGYGD